jgi:uncharacterized protein (DUF1697 family)
MARHIAFLRAINVGNHIVKMERLRTLFSGMGFANVETFIASGNVIFESRSSGAAALETRIERELEKALGYPVGTFVRSCPELADIAAHEPFDDLDGCALFVVFLKKPADAGLRRGIAALRGPTDDFIAHGRELYWRRQGSMSESPAAVPFAKLFGAGGTMRSVTTVRKLVAKYGR